MLKTIVRRTLISVLTIVIVVAIAAVAAFRASQAVPSFYRRVLVIAPEDTKAADDLERNVLELRNDAQRTGDWQAEFSEKEINSWLAVELPKNFPKALPPGVSDPRVAIEDGMIRFACRYDGKKIGTVVSLALDVSVTNQANVLMVRVDGAKAGWLPIPFKRFMEDVTRVARKSDVGLRWTDENGDPAALVTLPEITDRGRRLTIEIEAIEVGDGKVRCLGRTVSEQPTLYSE